MASPTPRLRWAIYTRKSTEEGLDKAFNSLDAQREACAAYVLSQQHEGWTLLPDYYDDGGFSGGTIERPALRQLLADVKSSKIDIVVVYKIDRLTRSLADFAKIVEVLDAADTSFVSVTQAFSTTNSMGRLTLNVLLSFAQFEREVITERIRDKVAASKARGMWMGGCVPLGFCAQNRKLVVVEDEAATVITIMERYLQSSSVAELLVALHRDGFVSKRRVARDGSPRGGLPFCRGALYAILANRTYIGEVVHQGNVYAGEHDAIVSRELFGAVQARLGERTNPRAPGCKRRPKSMLMGMIFDQFTRPMSPVHTHNHGRRYRYYASSLRDDSREPTQRLPAGELEAAVCRAVASWLGDSRNTRQLVAELETQALARLISCCAAFGRELREASLLDSREMMQALKLRVDVRPTGIAAAIDITSLLGGIGLEGTDLPKIEVAIAATPATFGHEPRLRLDPPAGLVTPRDERLVELITRAFIVREQLLAMTQDEVAMTPITSLRHLERVARLSYLDPAIVTAILDGAQPRTLTARFLSRMASLPLAWNEQRSALGFGPA